MKTDQNRSGVSKWALVPCLLMNFVTVSLFLAQLIGTLSVTELVSPATLLILNILALFISLLLLISNGWNGHLLRYTNHFLLASMIGIIFGLIPAHIVPDTDSVHSTIATLATYRDVFSVITFGSLALFASRSMMLITPSKEMTETEKSSNTNLYFLTAMIIVSLFYIWTQTLMHLTFNGSYIDEYTHIVSGKHFFEHGTFAQINDGRPYTRGAIMTLAVGLLMHFLQSTIFVAKLAPLISGFISFGLLFFIARQMLSRSGTVFVLILYSLSIAVLLNHFYVRFFAVYELCLLLCTYLFLKAGQSAGHKRNSYFLTIIGLLLALLITSRDNGAYMVAIYGIILLLAQQYIYRFQDTATIFTVIAKLNIAVKTMFVLALVAITAYLGLKLGIVDKILVIFLYTGVGAFPTNLLGYTKIFINDQILSTVFVFAPALLLLKYVAWSNRKILSFSDIAYIAFLSTFAIHLISAKDIQIFRGIFYIFPLYYLFAVYGLFQYIRSQALRIIIVILMCMALVFEYPVDFFSNPSIPREAVYLGGDIYNQVRSNCAGAILVSGQYPYVLNFYGIKVDAYIQENIGDDVNTGILKFASSTNSYETALDNVPVLTSLAQLQQIATASSKLCYLERSPVVRVWLDSATRDYIDAHFVELSADTGYRLFIYYSPI